MIDNLKRIREPLAWALIVLIVANLLLGVAKLVQQAQAAVVPLFEAFQQLGTSLLNLSAVIALILVLCTCFFIAPATPRARQLTLISAWVLTAGVVLTLICLILGAMSAGSAFGRTLEIVGAALDLLLKMVATGAVWLLLSGVRAGRIDTAPPAPPAPAPVVSESEAQPSPAAPKQIFGRGRSVGAAWRTADEAAQGAPGSARIEAPQPDPKDAKSAD